MSALGSGFRNGDFLDQIATLNPSIQSAEERTYASNSSFLELQRHPGAGRLVRSGAIKDDVTIAWNLQVTILELFWGQSHGTCNLH